jgi:hypothetical protein
MQTGVLRGENSLQVSAEIRPVHVLLFYREEWSEASNPQSKAHPTAPVFLATIIIIIIIMY